MPTISPQLSLPLDPALSRMPLPMVEGNIRAGFASPVDDFTVKPLGRAKLLAADPTFPDISFKDGQALRVCGVVAACVKRFRKN